MKVEGLGLKVEGSGFRVWVLGFRVKGSGFRVYGLEFMCQGSGFRLLTQPYLRAASTRRRAAFPSGCAGCGSGADCLAIKYPSLKIPERRGAYTHAHSRESPSSTPEPYSNQYRDNSLIRNAFPPRTTTGPSTVQGYLAKKKKPPPRTTTGP